MINLIAIKHRSLFGVEIEIFEVEYFIKILNPIHIHFYALLFNLNSVSKKFRALGKKDLAIYPDQLLNKDGIYTLLHTNERFHR